MGAEGLVVACDCLAEAANIAGSLEYCGATGGTGCSTSSLEAHIAGVESRLASGVHTVLSPLVLILAGGVLGRGLVGGTALVGATPLGATPLIAAEPAANASPLTARMPPPLTLAGALALCVLLALAARSVSCTCC